MSSFNFFNLDHVFISPEYIGKGYGKLLMDHFIAQSKIQNWLKINILAAPNSSKFYEKLGAEYIKEVPSNIKNRTVQYLVWDLSSKDYNPGLNIKFKIN